MTITKNYTIEIDLDDILDEFETSDILDALDEDDIRNYFDDNDLGTGAALFDLDNDYDRKRAIQEMVALKTRCYQDKETVKNVMLQIIDELF